MIDTETHLKFNEATTTEQRFAFRNWLEGWCKTLGDQSKKDLWQESLAKDVQILGLANDSMSRKDFLIFITRQHSLGGWSIRFPSGVVKHLSPARFELRGEIECFTANVVSCSGHAKVLIRLSQGKFALLSLEVEPRLRVNL